jgi:hypothetical protein
VYAEEQSLSLVLASFFWVHISDLASFKDLAELEGCLDLLQLLTSVGLLSFVDLSLHVQFKSMLGIQIVKGLLMLFMSITLSSARSLSIGGVQMPLLSSSSSSMSSFPCVLSAKE